MKICEQCRHFKNFKHSRGCGKKRKIITMNDTAKNKECFEPKISIFDGLFGGKGGLF